MCQTSSTVDRPDIVQKLMPDGVPPRAINLSAAEKGQVLEQLHLAQKSATGKRSQEVAFLLAALGSDYERNRDYLIKVLRGCNSPSIKNGCDEDTGGYLIALYERGHHEVLRPLLLAGMHNNGAALSEMLGTFYADVVTDNPREFLVAIRPLAISSQKELCELAGATDGGGMSPDDLIKVRKGLQAVDNEVARRCLREIELANKSR
jgi:hypothetical protein